MFSDLESFSSGFPTDPQDSLLFAPHSEYAADAQQFNPDPFPSLLEDVFDSPLLDVGPGGETFDLSYSPQTDNYATRHDGYSPHNTFPSMQSPLFNNVPRINVNTAIVGRYVDNGPSESSLLRTPLTPGIISPHTNGYLSSPNTLNPSPPTPARSLAMDGYVGVSTSPVSSLNGWNGRGMPEPMIVRGGGSPYSDMQLSSTTMIAPASARPRGPMVPQRRYRPHTSSDRRRYVEEVDLEPSIVFMMQKPHEQGISMQDAMHNRFAHLVGRDDLMFRERGPSISVRINWPGYAPWSRQIPTRDFRNPPGPITRAKLAKNVAKSVQRFIQEHQARPMEEDGEPVWRVGGRGGIDLFDLVLVQLDHVSRGSWQAQLQLLHPRTR